MNLIALIFWSFIGILGLFYCTYYGLMFVYARKSGSISDFNTKLYEFVGKEGCLPKISLIIATYNEEKVIKRKLMNIQGLIYPKEALEILVVDSGSIDNTVNLAKNFLENESIFPYRIVLQEKREGKASALNYCRQFCNGDILVITDADVSFEKNTLLQLVSRFKDASVGAISGKVIISNADKSTSTKIEKSYRDIFDVIRTGESNLDSTPIFNGQISAFRKELVDDLDPLTIADDTELSLRVREKGLKAIYEPLALAFEITPDNFKSKNKQKIRRGQGVIQSFLWHRKMIFNRKYGKYGLIILPSEFFMYSVSPVLVVMTIILGFFNIMLTPTFYLFFLIFISIFFGFFRLN